MTEPCAYAKHYSRGVGLYAAGHYGEALTALKKVLIFEPNYPDVYFLIARIYTELERYGDAVSMFEKVTALLPNDIEVSWLFGKTLLKSGNEKKGIKTLNKTLKLNPKDPRSRTELAKHYLDQNNFSKALSTVDTGIKANPECAPLHCLGGDILRMQKKFPKAQQYYEACLELDPQSQAGKRGFNAVMRAIESGNADAVDFSPEEDAKAEMVEAATLFSNGDYDLAIVRLLDLKDRHGVERDASMLLGMAFVQKGLYKRAHDVFCSFIQDHSPDIMVLYNLGLTCNRMGLYEDAISYLAEALERDDSFEEALIEMGIACLMTDQIVHACDYFINALKIERDNPRPYVYLAQISFEKNEEDKALELLKRAEACETESLEISFFKGYMAIKQEEYDRAKTFLQQCLDHTPDHFEALKLIGRAHIELGNSTAALEAFRDATALNPSDIECRERMKKLSFKT